ncbi:hypothetical protein LCGC14_1413600 [marine sediment metagenome]|uniref:Uncharacterized protein n=1 Tax=marine sediment metagenome TaxID=412755 RepID=A0A0F9KEK3_9ZZZZ
MSQEGSPAVDESRRVVPPEAGKEFVSEDQALNRQAVEDIDPKLLQMLLTLNEDEVIVPLRMKREEVSKVQAVKLSDEEVVKVSKFRVYLFDRGYLRDNTFASLFCYLYNVGYTLHKQLAEEEARKEAATQ